MSIPIDHHFLAEFYLRRWIDPKTSKLVEFSRPHRDVVHRDRFTSETGFQPNLYAVPSRTDAEARQEIETRVMSPLDSDAAKALAELELKGDIEDSALRVAWARFLMSLLYRSPRRVRGLRHKVRELDTTNLEAEYAQRRSASDPPTAADYLASVGDAFHDESAALLLKKLLAPSRSTIEFTVQMQWQRVSLPNQIHSILTCDDPILMSHGLARPDAFLILPVAPDALFLATTDSGVSVRFLREWKKSSASVAINDALCRNAHSLVMANSRAHRAFVERRLRKLDAPESYDLARNTWLAP